MRLFVKPLAGLAHWIAGFWEPTVVEGSIRSVAKAAQGGAGYCNGCKAAKSAPILPG